VGPLDFFQDIVGLGSPDERLGALVVLGEVVLDGLLKSTSSYRTTVSPKAPMRAVRGCFGGNVSTGDPGEERSMESMQLGYEDAQKPVYRAGLWVLVRVAVREELALLYGMARDDADDRRSTTRVREGLASASSSMMSASACCSSSGDPTICTWNGGSYWI
jgi:hypothetical protein